MGYDTDFSGEISVDPPLNAEEIAFLQRFNQTRRCKRGKGPYFVGDMQSGYGFRSEDITEDQTADVIDQNTPPEGQPGLWCHWVPTEDGKAITWDGGEKFYEADRWMKYIIEHFIGAEPVAKPQLPFLQGHICNGSIEAVGSEYGDYWEIKVTDNEVRRCDGEVVYNDGEIL